MTAGAGRKPRPAAGPEAMAGRWHPHVTAATVARRNGKYLLVREKHRGQSTLNQPAGHVEQGESLEQAAARETLEETGWHCEPKHLIGIYHFVAGNGATYIRFAFFGELLARADSALDPAIEEVLWLDRPALGNSSYNLRSQVVTRCIDDFEAGQQIPRNCVKCLQL